MREHYVNLTVANHDFFNEGIDDFTLVLRWQFGLPVMKRVGFMHHVIGRKLVDLQEIHFGFELRQFSQKLLQPPFGGFIELAKSLGGDLFLQIELMRPIHIISHFLDFLPVRAKQGGGLGQVPVGLIQMLRDPLRLAEKSGIMHLTKV
jgi:hypothetical protein